MKQLFHTPEGVRDVYGMECEKKLYLQEKLQKVFHAYGYQNIETPSLEYFDVFGKQVGTTPSRDLYKFFDREGNTLVLRPDFTPSIARAASMYFHKEELPVRLCYRGNTFVNSSSYQGRLKESTQMGVELIGDASVDADGEIIALTVQLLKETGLKEFQISIGQVDFFEALIVEAGLSEDTVQKLRELISNKNYFGVEELLESQNLSKELVEVFSLLPQLFGSLEVLERARKLTGNPEALRAIDRLEEIYQVLQQYGCEHYISFDLGMLSRYQYYTGIIFQGYTYGTGEPLVKGGRYNHLLEHFGSPAPAIGFGLVMEQVLNALERQKIDVPIMKARTLILYPESSRHLAICIAKEHRLHQMEVQCMRLEEGKTRDDYIAYAKHHQFGDLIYPVSEEEIRVMNLFTDEVQITNLRSFR
ncbi:MAG: ATP phosphoribosyltransferase regulatory subunit [Clostridiales bacterium]|nr:ATP phosphoribosyltransferase regulatory subunit [Clostridiales bacterium]